MGVSSLAAAVRHFRAQHVTESRAATLIVSMWVSPSWSLRMANEMEEMRLAGGGRTAVVRRGDRILRPGTSSLGRASPLRWSIGRSPVP
jgi:hypothetical protein